MLLFQFHPSSSSYLYCIFKRFIHEDVNCQFLAEGNFHENMPASIPILLIILTFAIHFPHKRHYGCLHLLSLRKSLELDSCRYGKGKYRPRWPCAVLLYFEISVLSCSPTHIPGSRTKEVEGRRKGYMDGDFKKNRVGI